MKNLPHRNISSFLIVNRGMVAGKDIGLISYNDTELKEIIEGVIPADFARMGQFVGVFCPADRKE